jgi:hypothetical protein
MKGIVVGIILIFFASTGHSLVVNCTFEMRGWPVVGQVYACVSRIENYSSGASFIDEIRGNHLAGKTNADVQFIWERTNILPYMFMNLASFFPNLRGMIIEAPLRQLTLNDMHKYPELIFVVFNGAQYTSIDSNLFQQTKKLQRIDF